MAIIADAQHVVVVAVHRQQRSLIVRGTTRAALVRTVQRLVPKPQSLRGIILCIRGLSFSATRSAVATTNALAYAARCPVVRVEDQAAGSTRTVLTHGEQLLTQHPPRWITPSYSAAPNITQPLRGARFHENAGGIVYDPKQRALLFVQRKDNGVVGTPKGHREHGEHLVRTAMREIAEETGITSLQLVAKLPAVRYLSDDHGKLPKSIPHHLHHFLFLRTSNTTVPRVVTGEVANLTLLWWPASGASVPKKLHRDLRPVLQRAREILRARRFLTPQPKRSKALERSHR